MNKNAKPSHHRVIAVSVRKSVNKTERLIRGVGGRVTVTRSLSHRAASFLPKKGLSLPSPNIYEHPVLLCRHCGIAVALTETRQWLFTEYRLRSLSACFDCAMARFKARTINGKHRVLPVSKKAFSEVNRVSRLKSKGSS